MERRRLGLPSFDQGRHRTKGLVLGAAVGGLGHALPYLIPDFWTATILATIIVFVELGVISWMWMKWDHANVRVPDKNGQMRSLRLTASFTPYFGRWLMGWLLSLATAGIYRPWAKVAEWRWMADHTDIS